MEIQTIKYDDTPSHEGLEAIMKPALTAFHQNEFGYFMIGIAPDGEGGHVATRTNLHISSAIELLEGALEQLRSTHN